MNVLCMYVDRCGNVLLVDQENRVLVGALHCSNLTFSLGVTKDLNFTPFQQVSQLATSSSDQFVSCLSSVITNRGGYRVLRVLDQRDHIIPTVSLFNYSVRSISLLR